MEKEFKENTIKYRDYRREYYIENREKIRGRHKEYRKVHLKEINENQKKYTENHKEEKRKYDKKYREANKQKIENYRKKYYKNNKEKMLKSNIDYKNKKYANNPIFRLNNLIASGIRKSLKSSKNGRHWENLVDYNCKQLKEYLEKQFKDGMTWDNYGRNGWEIDHRIPISLFNITSVKSKGFKQCWALENLRPMWFKDNREKGNKLFY